MYKTNKKQATRLLLSILMGAALSGCGMTERLADVGRAPAMSPIVNPQAQPNYRPVSMPMPAPQIVTHQPNSLWLSSRKSFFKDQRACNVGDILTVVIDIDDKGELKNKTTRTRTGAESVGVPHLLGFETQLHKILPKSSDVNNLAEASTDSSHVGDGEIKRDEKIEMKLAATITQILPNGTMVIEGRQEVRMNFEKRILSISGIIRPEDISTDNSIPYEKIAQARIIYGGKGQLTDVQQPRYGQQVLDIISPF